MKRNEEGKIFIKASGMFEVLVDNVSNREDRKVLLNSLYEHIEVFTDKGQSIPAYKYYPSEHLGGLREVDSYGVSQAQPEEGQPHIPAGPAKSAKDYDPIQNCLGFCILDSEYWINLTRETMDHILADDSYVEVTESYPEDHLVIYYINESPVHISRFNAALRQYEHKPGLNSPLYMDNADIDEFYQYSGIKYYRKGQPI